MKPISPNMLVVLALSSVLLVALGGPTAVAQESSGPEGTVAYVNGHVWNGDRFEDRPLYVRGGRFVTPSAAADTTIDLNGGYAIPPFGDAHTHNFGAGYASVEMADSLYVPQGIVYAADLTTPYSEITAQRDFFETPMSIREWFDKPTTLDVAYALGGLTTSGNHPAPLMENIYGDDVDSTWSLAGDAYWFLDTMTDVRTKWPRYLEQDPDLVKVYVMDAGNDLDTGWGETLRREGCGLGLCPEELRALVERAHAAGKRVSAHVNTAADVRLALDAGVDELAHLPLGNDGISIDESAPYRLRDETIRRIGEENMVVSPTALLLVEEVESLPADTLREEIALQRKQIRELYEAGARIALSGHNWQQTARREALYFHAHNFFNNRTLLRLWATTTPRAVFPNRQIGRLTPGYEASFLVLKANPLRDFHAVRDIDRRLKQGHRLGTREP